MLGAFCAQGWPFKFVTSFHPPICLVEEERTIVLPQLQTKRVGQGRESKSLSQGRPAAPGASSGVRHASLLPCQHVPLPCQLFGVFPVQMFVPDSDGGWAHLTDFPTLSSADLSSPSASGLRAKHAAGHGRARAEARRQAALRPTADPNFSPGAEQALPVSR